MIVLRLVGLLALIAIAGSLALYLVTREPRYLEIARRVFQFALVFGLAFLVLYLLERLIAVV
jgi:hypothetical protein